MVLQVVAAVIGLVFLLGPVALSLLHIPLTTATTLICMILGIVLLGGSALLSIISKLYMRASAGAALVRTGMGGLKVVQDGGILVVPIVHNAIRVPLQTITLKVDRANSDALITLDKLRTDMHVVFYVRVKAAVPAITNAARSFGDGMSQESIMRVVGDKLVSALRQVAATKTLEELNSQLKGFLDEVRGVITDDLEHNGLSLESAAINRLDQTDPKMLKDANIFDAQGLKAAAAITQEQRTQRNEIERAGERLRAQQDVETRQRILELERLRVEAEMTQQTQIAAIKAEQERIAQQKNLEAAQAVSLSKVAQQRDLQVAETRQQQEVQLTQQEQARQVQLAKVKQQQDLEVANRERQARIAEADRVAALAEASRAEAEAKRAQAQQAIQMVEVEAQAERERRQKIIAAEAAAAQRQIEAEQQAKAAAYKIQTEAQAQLSSAEASAASIIKRSEAESRAAELRAQGMRAEQLVPVQVEQQRVQVEQQRVDVLRTEMEAREKHGSAQQTFELRKLEIEAEARVRIAAANATATLMGKFSANVYGTPEDVARMTGQFMRGMGVSQMVEGFSAGSGPACDKLANLAQNLADAAVKKLDPSNSSSAGQ